MKPVRVVWCPVGDTAHDRGSNGIIVRMEKECTVIQWDGVNRTCRYDNRLLLTWIISPETCRHCRHRLKRAIGWRCPEWIDDE